MDKIRDNIYIGDAEDAKDIEKLKAEGITAVLNVAYNVPSEPSLIENFKSHKVGLIDGEGNSPIVAGCALMLFNGLLREGHKVLVHCRLGISRSPIIVASHLRACGEFWSIEDAVTSLKHYRSVVEPKQELVDLFSKIIDSSMK